MSDHERGPYSPGSEPPLAFDPRRPVRGAGPAPLSLIISGLILVALIGAVAFIYRGGVRHGDQPPAPVGEPLTDIKTPAPPDAADNAASGLTIYRTDASNAASNAAPTLAPPPEQPLPAAPAAAPPPPQQAPPQQVVALAPPAPPAPAAKPAKPGPSTIGELADAAASAKAKAASAKAAAKPAAPATPSEAAAAPPPGAEWVQIGALSSPALADKAWSDIARLEPAAMLGKGKKVEPVNRDGKDLYRTYITGFSSHAQAEAFCGKLEAAGKSCMVK